MLLDNMIACAPPQHSTQNAPSVAEANTTQLSESDDQQASVDAAVASTSHHKPSSLDGAASRQPAAHLQLHQTDACNVSESSHDALHTASMSNRCAEAHLGATDMRDSMNQPSDATNQSPGSTTEEAAGVGSSRSASGPSANQTRDQTSAGLQTSHEAAIQQAVEHWACRLEMAPAGKAAKPKAKRHLSRRQRAHIRHAVEQQNQIDDVAGEHQLFICLAGCVCKYIFFLLCAVWDQHTSLSLQMLHTSAHDLVISSVPTCIVKSSFVWGCTHLHGVKVGHLHH